MDLEQLLNDTLEEFFLQTFLDSEFIWRVQGCARAKFSIPGPDSVDWFVFDAEIMIFLRIMKNIKNLYSLIRSLILMSNVIQSANNISMAALLLNFLRYRKLCYIKSRLSALALNLSSVQWAYTSYALTFVYPYLLQQN